MTHMFLLNLFLAAVYLALVGQAGPMDILTGMFVGYLVLTLYGMATNAPSYGRKVYHLVSFGLYFMWILFKANLAIAWEIITPGFRQTPRILRYPVGHLNDIELTTLANCITLTPGTLVVDVSDDGAWLYVHCMYAKDEDKAVSELDQLADRLQAKVFAS